MKKRGGARPGAGRPAGSKNSAPRPCGPKRVLVALSAHLATRAHEISRSQGVTLREWMDHAVALEISRLAIKEEIEAEADSFSDGYDDPCSAVLIF